MTDFTQGPEFEALVRAVVDAAGPRVLHAAGAAVDAALDKAPQWRLIPATIDPDSIQGPLVEAWPDDTPDDSVQIIRLDPRQGVPSSNDGERTRVLILHTPPAGGFALGIIPDDPEADELAPTTVHPEAYRTKVNSFVSTTSEAAKSATGDTDMQLLDQATVPGRDYLFHLKSEVQFTNAAGLWTLNLHVDGVQPDRFFRQHLIAAPGATLAVTCDAWIEWTAEDSGPHDFIVHAIEHSGTTTLQMVASATVPRTFTMWGTT
jgi:hypothetical protein